MLLGCRKDYDNRDIDLCGSHPVLFDYDGYACTGRSSGSMASAVHDVGIAYKQYDAGRSCRSLPMQAKACCAIWQGWNRVRACKC
jgi:hypothetical protein